MHSGIILCPYKPTSSGQGYGVSSSSSFANLPPPRGNQEQSSQIFLSITCDKNYKFLLLNFLHSGILLLLLIFLKNIIAIEEKL
jgi:hypothetical protein